MRRVADLVLGVLSLVACGTSGGTAGPDAASPDAASLADAEADVSASCARARQLVQASSYDQSCVTDSECVAVAQPQDGCCGEAPISVKARAQFMSNLALETAACPPQNCTTYCAAVIGPCCRAGLCQLGFGRLAGASADGAPPACMSVGGDDAGSVDGSAEAASSEAGDAGS
jgi:hypothetical protein